LTTTLRNRLYSGIEVGGEYNLYRQPYKYCNVLPNSSINLKVLSFNLNVTNLIKILSDSSIYNEIYKLMGSNLDIYASRFMSFEDKQALFNRSESMLKGIIESLKN
jgi:hypothetical protein